MWEQLTMPLDFATMELTTTEKEKNAKKLTTKSY